jgi:dihydrofolate synthase/folylpolyglutamate synthase
MKFGLRNISALLHSVGDPHQKFSSVHVAGTNGKGSTSAFIASIMQEAGYRVGLYTSPHLVRFTERIRIAGREMQEARLVSYVERLRDAIEEYRATFFEATTCVAFLYFAEEEVDVSVIETGLGGRLDSTNVLTPLVSVITNVSMDHMEYLGHSVSAIAGEKAGIIKRGVPVVCGPLHPDAEKVVRRVADHRAAPLVYAADLVRIQPGRDGAARVFVNNTHRFSVRPGLPGAYQYLNAGLAISALQVLLQFSKARRGFPDLSIASMRRGIERVKENTGLRGRFQTIRKKGKWLLDVAHNPAGMQELVNQIAVERGKPRIAVFGAMKDKDCAGMIRLLSQEVRTFVFVKPSLERAIPVSTLVRIAARCGARGIYGGSVRRGLEKARSLAPRGTIVVTGSHYVVGEALHEFTQS